MADLADVIKVLMVREFFRSGQLVEEETTLTVWMIEPGKELGLGFARVMNVSGEARFCVVQEFHGNVDVTPDLSVPVTYFNGVPCEAVCDAPLKFGDRIQVHYPHEEDLLVSKDFVVLVPTGTPAQLLA